MTPFSRPTSTSMGISSSVTLSSLALGSKPNSRTTRFVAPESTFTNGEKIVLQTSRMPTTAKAIFSLFCIAIRLGASSPSTREKKEMTIVISTTETELTTVWGMPVPSPTNQSVKSAAKFVAAEAEVRKPANVTPIWIVDKKLLGFSVKRLTCLAFLLPSSAILSIILSFNEMMAISLIAKKALMMMSTKSRISLKIILPGSSIEDLNSFPWISNFYLLAIILQKIKNVKYSIAFFAKT